MRYLHIIAHTHWDREWYMSFEEHRMRLVSLIDSLIEIMENDKGFTYFHLDGQYIVIEDYLEIRPHMKERLYKLIREDRIQVGPWYVLQDEYLTSGEANIRNMLYGLKMCRDIGAKPVMCGYLPDAFGNISQAPQILRGFGIDCAVFGRGLIDVFADNKIGGKASQEHSEIIWRSPDGSEVTGIVFMNWYHNAMELPADKNELRGRLDSIIAQTERYALTPHLLGMNGCDHQPVQADLHKVIELSNQILRDKDITVKQSNFKDYIDAVRPYRHGFPVVEGELNGQRSSGLNNLVNTASSRAEIKQMNFRAQNALEMRAEPLNSISYLLGDKYRSDFLFYSWKTLLKNHAHDSICSCNVDEVSDEMMIRFAKSIQVSNGVEDGAAEYISGNIDTAELGDRNIVLFHLDAEPSVRLVTAYIDLPLDEETPELSVLDADGKVVPSVFRPLGKTFVYTLPDDKFRKASYVNRYEVKMLARLGNDIGYEVYRVEKRSLPSTGSIKVEGRCAENRYIALKINANGSFSVTDKSSGQVYGPLNIYEDTGDRGDTYNYRQTDDRSSLTTHNDTAVISVEEQTPFYVTYKIENHLDIPAGLDNTARASKVIPHTIYTYVTLIQESRRIEVKTVLGNRSENHRVRALFDPAIATETVLAAGQFDVVERSVTPPEQWENPCNTQRFEAFFALENAKRGLLVSTEGLHEYEVLRNGDTMALTLLRCVGELGDWGEFATPKAQCKGEYTFRYSIVAYTPETKESAFSEGFAYHAQAFKCVSTGRHEGRLPAQLRLFELNGDFIRVSALKKCETRESVILRLYNSSGKDQKGAHQAGRKHCRRLSCKLGGNKAKPARYKRS